LLIVKIDSDKYGSLASRFRVEGLPTLVLFKGGQPVDRIEGALPEADICRRLDYMLAH
jgi:thioredoxin-like negative regulator of GroEL